MGSRAEGLLGSAPHVILVFIDKLILVHFHFGHFKYDHLSPLSRTRGALGHKVSDAFQVLISKGMTFSKASPPPKTTQALEDLRENLSREIGRIFQACPSVRGAASTGPPRTATGPGPRLPGVKRQPTRARDPLLGTNAVRLLPSAVAPWHPGSSGRAPPCPIL